MDLKELHWAVCQSERNDHLRAGLHYVNMRRAVLAGRQENPDRKATRPDYGGQWTLTQRLGYYNRGGGLLGERSPEHG